MSKTRQSDDLDSTLDYTLTYSPKLRLPNLPETEVHVLVFDLVSSATHLTAFREVLSPDEVARAEKFHFPIHAERFATTRGMLRCLLSQYVDVQPGEIEFAYGSAGKPSLANRNAKGQGGLQFNVSHSNDQCLVAFSRGMEIGTDIEWRLREFSDMDQLAKRCLSDDDFARFLSVGESAKRDAFLRFWTRKEAMIKATGIGLGHPLKNFDVSFLVNEPAKLVRSDEAFGDVDAWSLEDIEVSSEYQSAIAFRSREYVVRQLRHDDLV